MSACKNKRGAACYIIGLLLTIVLVVIISPGSVALAACNTQNIRLVGSDTVSLESFSVENMFPGDSVTKDFTITVAHRDAVTVYYKANIMYGVAVVQIAAVKSC